MNFGAKNKVKVGGGMASISAVILVMLIFFLVMIVVAKKEDKPSTDTETVATFTPAITVVITKDNQYFLLPDESDKDKRSFDEIKELIIKKVVDSESKQLKIEGNQLAKYESIYNVAGLAQKNNWQYQLDYTKETAPE